MGRYVKGSGEVAVMDKAAAAAAAAARRKRNTVLREPELSTSSTSIQLKTRRLAEATPEISVSSSPESSGNSTCESLTSCCSSTEFADLEQENEVTTVQVLVDFRERIENPPWSLVEAESPVMPPESNSHGCSAAEKMPTEAELEEFFAVAETNLQKQFIDKYNYDIAKDEPLEGRYEWVKIHVKP